MNGAEFKSMIATYLNRTDMTSMIATASALAVKKLEREGLHLQYTSTTLTTTNAQSYLSYPSGFLLELFDGLKDSSGSSLLKTDWATLDHWIRHSAGKGEPDWYALADKIYFYPIPDAAYTLTIQYIKALGFPGDSTSNCWTDQYYDATYWATIEEMWKHLRNTDEEVKAKTQKLLVLKDLKSMTGKLVGTGQVQYRDY